MVCRGEETPVAAFGGSPALLSPWCLARPHPQVRCSQWPGLPRAFALCVFQIIYLRGRGTNGLQRNTLAENVLEKSKEELEALGSRTSWHGSLEGQGNPESGTGLHFLSYFTLAKLPNLPNYSVVLWLKVDFCSGVGQRIAF